MFFSLSGKRFPPTIIFKGSPGGRIQKREFPTFPANAFYDCQPKAWCDESVMLTWVEKVVKPWADSVPIGVVPLLILDSFKVHLQGSVTDAIQDCGVELEHNPGGLTGLCQPVDVGINKPFKGLIKKRWNEWMMEEGLVGAVTKPSSRKLVAEWIVGSYNELSDFIVKNSWKKTNFSWFFE